MEFGLRFDQSADSDAVFDAIIRRLKQEFVADLLQHLRLFGSLFLRQTFVDVARLGPNFWRDRFKLVLKCFSYAKLVLHALVI